MINLNLTFGSIAEMHATLTALLQGTTPVVVVSPAPVAVEIEPAKVVKQAPKSAKPAATQAASATAAPAPAPEPAPAEPVAVSPSDEPKAITLEFVRAKLAALSQAGKAPAVKALIADTGFAKLTEIPADQYPAILEKAAAL